MSDPLMIYGATGYTGRLLAERARAIGLDPVLGGRDAARVEALGRTLGCATRSTSLTDAVALADALRGIRVVLHAAGPFAETTAPMVAACIEAGSHYLDITAEIDQIEAMARLDRVAGTRGIMVMPGVGFDVVASDCLAAYVANRLPGARRLSIGLAGWSFASRGSVKTMLRYLHGSVRTRRDHRIVDVPAGSLERTFDYGDGLRASSAVSWGDVASAYYTTGIPDVATYFESTAAVRTTLAATRYFGSLLTAAPTQAWLSAQTAFLPEGPPPDLRVARRMTVVAEVEDEHGGRAAARLQTPDPYTFTANAAPEIARRVLEGDLEPGFQTPGRVYGADFVLGLADVAREDLS